MLQLQDLKFSQMFCKTAFSLIYLPIKSNKFSGTSAFLYAYDCGKDLLRA